LPDLVSIDLGLPPDRQSPRYGLELLEQVTHKFSGLKIVVHSSIVPIPERAAQFILSIPASYISTAHDLDMQAYAQMLPWIARGFRVYSPLVCDMLSRVLLHQPDPLDDEEWRIVEQIAASHTNAQIGRDMGYAETTVAEKVARIARRLNALGHIDVNTEDRRPIPNRYREALTRFHAENATRYKRTRRSG
jgi:DNA-binding NarL/FixJ family response regulator